MILHIIRHGDPDYERDSLTPLGRAQADALARSLAAAPLRRIFCSPLGRAQDTARPASLASALPVETLPWLREMDDVTVRDTHRPDLAVWKIAPPRLLGLDTAHWTHSELFHDTKLAERMAELKAGADTLLSEYGILRRENGLAADRDLSGAGEAAIFCHLGVGLTLTAYLLGLCPAYLWGTAYLAPSSVTTLLLEQLENRRCGFRMLRMGDISHLFRAGLPAGTSGLLCNSTET